MNNKSEDATKSEVLPVQMGYESKFKFKCHKGISCFTDCCRGIDIMLTPYDVVTMKKRLGLTSDEFLAVYTDLKFLEKAGLPIVTMKLLDDDRKSCPFVDDKEGCLIYEDRPSTCRYYPLGMGSLSYANETGDGDEFFFTVKEDHCRGFEEDKEWSVAEWREDQGVDIRDEINAGWTNLIVRKKTVPDRIRLTEQAKQMFFMVCYNVDRFRRFVFESGFLDKVQLDEELVAQIKEDDIQLIKFGFDWLKELLFSDGDIAPGEGAPPRTET